MTFKPLKEENQSMPQDRYTPGPGFRTSKGRRFGGAYHGPSPVELFDAGRYAECLHACFFILGRLGDAKRLQLAIEDDVYLHELVHLLLGVEICTHNTMQDLRGEIVGLWRDYVRENDAGGNSESKGRDG